MSEEKTYVVKNDEGDYWDFKDLDGFWELFDIVPFTVSEENAKNTAKEHGGHVVALIEEPEKVVLTEKQAEIVDAAHDFGYPATHISNQYEDEELLMEAYVNGYTVAKEKKWRLPVPKAWRGDSCHYWHKESDGTLTWRILAGRIEEFEFTEDEINKYKLQSCEKEEVTDDEQ